MVGSWITRGWVPPTERGAASRADVLVGLGRTARPGSGRHRSQRDQPARQTPGRELLARKFRCRRASAAGIAHPRAISGHGRGRSDIADDGFLTILLVLAMLGTLTVLGFGVARLLRGGDPRRSNKLMQSRVIMQALAIVLLAMLMLLARH